jgi:hypothetical protein
LPDRCDPPRVVPEEPFAFVPLCCDPNGSRSSHCGLLTPWSTTISVSPERMKFWMKVRTDIKSNNANEPDFPQADL